MIALVGTLLALVTAACGGGTQTPSDPDVGGVHAVVTPGQALQVLGSVDAALVRASAARDVTTLQGRALGPIKETVTASVIVQAGLKQAPSSLPAPTQPRLMLPLSGRWPRWFLAAGSTPASPTPLLRVLLSPDPRSPYGLWAQLNLLPGASLPEIAPPTDGAAALSPTATGLAATPADALARYTDLLNRGDASSYAKDFTVDTFRSQLTTQLGADRKAFESVDLGDVMASHALAKDAPFALRTRDGGALVIGRIDQTWTVTIAAGKGSAKLDPALAVLVGKPSISQRLERHAVEVVALYVPKAGAGAGAAEKITLLAASKSDVSATGN
jgi:hypothetical protein